MNDNVPRKETVAEREQRRVEMAKRIKTLQKMGLRPKQIAERLCCTPSAIHHYTSPTGKFHHFLSVEVPDAMEK